MVTKQGVKSYLTLLFQADGILNKLIVLNYFLKAPHRRLNKNHDYNLLKPIRVKTIVGSLWSNKDIFSAVALTSNFEIDVKKQLILKSGAFLDIGANIGGHTFYVAKKYPNNKVLAIEPEPHNLLTLNKNFKELNLSNISIVSKGCFSKKAKLKLFLDDKGSGQHSLIGKGRFISIDVDTVDNITKKFEIKKVDLMKIDVEGAELQVLEGSKKIIQKQKPKIIFESLNNDRLDEITRFLSKNKYVVKKLDSQNYIAEYNKDI